MWNRILGKSNAIEKNPSTSKSRPESETQRSTSHHSESSKSIPSSRRATQFEERDQGFNPTSTSYSSTTQNKYPGTAAASIGSSFTTAFNDPTSDSYLPPSLVRNASLADQIPKSSSGGGEGGVTLGPSRNLEREEEEPSNMDFKRDRKERRGTRDRDDSKRESKRTRDKKGRRDSEGRSERGISTDETAYKESRRSSRAVDPPDQPPLHSSHVQDQFPGQFSTYSATPYRPPLAASEGGPGLAAEYYGDAGQSVADQPGHRTHSPSLIVGAEPHLQAASAVVAPPPEPSASGGVGAAASFFDGSFNVGSDLDDHHGQEPASTNGPSVPQYSSAMPPSTTHSVTASGYTNHHSTSEPVIPTLGAAAAGAAAGYYMSNRPSKPDRPVNASSSMTGHGSFAGSLSYQESAAIHDEPTSYSSSTRPPSNPGKQSSQSANIPLYAAGAAGLAAAAYHHNHQDTSTQHHSSGQQYLGGSMAQQHRHRQRHHGPLSKLVDFFKDPEGVARFEEYTEYIGVCRYCFEPGSSPRDAPRKHNYRRRRSNERFGSSVRVDKDSRYWSSENERRRRKDKTWLEAGVAGYGLGKMGENLFKQDRDFDDYSVRSGRVAKSHRRRSSSSSLDRKSRTHRGVVNRSSDSLPRKSRSNDKVETGVTSDGRLYRKNSHGDIETSSVKTHTSRHRSRSRSRDRKSTIAEAALGAAIGSSVIASTSRRRSSSPKRAFVRSKHGNEVDSSKLASVLRLQDSESHDGRRRPHRSPSSRHHKDRKKEKKSRGFFSFSNGSSSSSGSSNLAFGVDMERKSVKGTKSRKKERESRDADAALLGLGAAAAALALNQSQRSKHKSELIAVKESKGKGKSSKHGHKSKKSSSSSSEDQWESASEGEWSSADSELAYGASLHRRSRESLSSDSSGLDKWGWRWGSKKAKKPASNREHSSGFDHNNSLAGTSAAMLGAAQVSSDQHRQDSRMTSSSSVPLQYVYPMPTSDPTQYDVARHDSGVPFHQFHMNGRPDPVPIQHPQPVAPVSQAVYTTQSPYVHSYSAPIGPSMSMQYSHPSAISRDHNVPDGVRDQVPGSFPTGSEYFETFMQDSNKGSKPRRRDSSPVTRTSEYATSSIGPQRRKSLKDESSSVRFDLTKEQEDKDRREERRRRKENEKRRERRERQVIDERKRLEHGSSEKRDTTKTDDEARSHQSTSGEPNNVKMESWAAPAAAGVIAAAIGATVASEGSSKRERRDRHEENDRANEDRDIEVVVKERHAKGAESASRDAGGRNEPSKGEAMSVWQAAAKLKRTSSHTDYAAYFTPPELLSKSSDVKQVVSANADNDITVYQVPHVVTVEPSATRGRSPSRAYSFPIEAESLEEDKKTFPWSVPQLNLVEPTPPTSRAGSIAGSRSPQSRSPLSREVPVIDIPLEPLESVTDASVTYAEPEHVEYTVIEPKGHREPSVDSPTTEINISESVPGISSLKKRNNRKEATPEPVYSDDLDFAATVAAGLQDTGFNPSIVIDDPSFRRRDSPPGSEEGRFRRGPTAVVTEMTAESEEPRSPPHGFVEEIPEHHMPGSFGEDEERTSHQHPELREKNLESATDLDEPDHTTAELTGPSDNVGARPHVYEVEPVPIETKDLSNATFDPMAPSKEQKTSEHEMVVQEFTEPADNARADPKVYSAEPESIDSSMPRDRSIEAMSEPERSSSVLEENTSSSLDKVDYPSDEAPSVAATAPVSSSSGQGSKSKKKSKRRSVGFEDTHSVVSAPATFEDAQDSSAKPDKSRKGGIFGLFSKSNENISDSKGSEGTPVEANLEDFEEPKKRSKKSKNRKSTFDEERETATEAVSTGPPQVEGQDDWSTSKKSKRGKEKRRSSEGNTTQDSGRITQDLPAQDPNDDRAEEPGSATGLDDLDDIPRPHHDKEPSFLGERPEKPPLPDLPDASEDPGGQLEGPDILEKSALPESQSETPTKADKQKWRLSDIQSDGRSVSYSSPSPTAVPFRPLRFGRRPSSPGLAKSLPSTPQPSIIADLPMTPRRRERPHSTEFKSNEFRPIWLLEKHGSRQEPAPQESYPSLPSSHSTSRASSVHEADDLTQADTDDVASSGFSNYQITSGRRGLAIDTSLYEPDSELLDSQQATPTAASFQSNLKDGGADTQATDHESKQPEHELIDAIPPADAYVDPTKEPAQDERLLHGIDDLFPQRRSNSPSRYGMAATTETPQQPEIEELSSEGKGDKKDGGLATMIRDTALGAFIGGSAAALLKSTSKHNENLEQSSHDAELGSNVDDDADLPAKPVDTDSRRPTVEEMRLMQEQDAQDGVDTWFAPAQPKRTKSKKGKKQAESSEVSESPTTTDPSRQASMERQFTNVNDHAPAVKDEKTRSIVDDAALTAEPGQTAEAPQSDLSTREAGTETTGVDWQAALTTRKDSKGKKKKNKKKSVDARDENTILPDEPTAEQLSIPSTAPEEVAASNESPVNDTPTADPDADALGVPRNLGSEIETPQEAEASSVASVIQEVPTSTKKNKKGKKKNRQSFQTESSEAVTPEEPLAATSAEESKDIASELPAEVSNTPSIDAVAKNIGPDSSLSEAVPYEFPRSEEMNSEEPNDLQPAEQPLSSEANVESERKVEPQEKVLDMSQQLMPEPSIARDLPVQDFPEGEAATAAELTGRDQPQIQKSESAALDSQMLPENIPLPLSDDLDLTQPPPDSPVIQPVDAAISAETKKPESAALYSQKLPENIPLPLSDDLDLTQPPPDSSVIQPIDIALSAETAHVATSENLEASDQKNEPATVRSSSALESLNPEAASDSAPIDSDDAQNVLTKAISELNLPARAIEDQRAEFAKIEPEENANAAQEHPEDEWLTFTPGISKRAKKDRTKISTEAETGQDVLELQSPKAEESATRDQLPVQDLPSEPPSTETEDLTPQHVGVQEVVKADKGDETGERSAKPSLEGTEEDLDFPTTTKKKKKGKKGKKVQFDELEEISEQQPERSTAKEIPSASTSTAEEVENLLHEPEPGTADVTADAPVSQDTPHLPRVLDVRSKDRVILSKDPTAAESFSEARELSEPGAIAENINIPLRDSLPTPSLPPSNISGAIVDHSSGDLGSVLAEENDPQAQREAKASTSTAAEIQSMLTRDQEPDVQPVIGQDAINDAPQSTEADDFAWAPKKKKKGKKSKSADEAVTETFKTPGDVQPEVSVSDEAPTAAESISASGPVEEFSVKKSKKDKKSKRKGLSRSTSDLQEEEGSQTPPVVEDRKEERALLNDAPLSVEKTDQLPSVELPMSPEVAGTEVPLDPVAVDEPQTLINATQGTDKEEMMTTADVPSPEAVIDESSVVNPDHPTSASAAGKTHEVAKDEPANVIIHPLDARDTTMPPVEDPSTMDFQDKAISDMVSLELATSDLSRSEEPSGPLTETDSIPISDQQAVSQSPKEEVLDEISVTAPDEETVFQPPMSSKTKKKAKKAKALQWEDGVSASAPEQTAQFNDTVSEPTNGATSEAPMEAPVKTKKDKKKSKKAKALDRLEEEPAGSPKEPLDMVQAMSEERGSDTTVPETIPLVPEAVMAEEISDDTKKSEATAEGPEKVDAPEKGESLPVLSSEQTVGPGKDKPKVIDPAFEKSVELVKGGKMPGAFESLPESNELAKSGDLGTRGELDESSQESATEQRIASVAEDTPAVSEEPLKSKKDKKKAKKLKTETQDDIPSTSIGFEDPQQENVGMENKTSTEAIDGPSSEIVEEPPKSKKDKKKSKKNKSSALEEQEPVTFSAGESQQEGQRADSEIVDEQSRAVADAQDEETVGNLPDEQATRKKGKKKGKKSKFPAWDEDSSIPPSRDETDQQLPRSTEEETVTQPLEGAHVTQVEEQVETPEIQATAKKGKKKGKKSKFVAWDEDPSVPSPSGEKEQSPLDSETRSVETGSGVPTVDNEEGKHDVEESIGTLGRKRDKKKTKKSNVLALEDEPLPSASQDLVASDTKDLADQPEELMESSKAEVPGEMDELVASNDLDLTQDVGTTQKDGPWAKTMPTPKTADEDGVVQGIIQAPTDEKSVYKEEPPSMMLDPHPELTLIPPTDNVEVTDASLQAMVEDIEAPEGSSSIRNEDNSTKPEPENMVQPSLNQQSEDHPETLSQPSDLRPEPITAPSIDNALKTTDEVIPPTSFDNAGGASPMPEIIDTKRSTYPHIDILDTSSNKMKVPDTELEAIYSARDTPQVVGEGITSQPDEDVGVRSPAPEIQGEMSDVDSVTTKTHTPQFVEEELQAVVQEQIVPETEVVADVAEQPASSTGVAETENIDNAEQFPSTSKKDKKKAKKAKKAMALEDEILEPSAFDNTMPITEPETGRSEVLDREAAEEPALPAEPTNPEIVDELPSTSRKDKKKAKKNKKLINLDEEPSESTIPAELEPPTEVISEKSILPEDSATIENVDEFSSLNRNDKKKAKKTKKGLSWEDEPVSESTTPAEPVSVLESDDKAAEEPVLPGEADVVDNTFEEFPAVGKKDKKKGKKSRKSIAFDEEEPSGTVTPSTPVAEVEDLDRSTGEPSVSAEPDVAEAVDEVFSMSKKDKKKAKKGKKSLTFDEEPSGSTTPSTPAADVDDLNRGLDDPSASAEPIVVEAVDEFSSMSKKDKKKAKKSKKSYSFDDELAEPTMPAEPDPSSEVISKVEEPISQADDPSTITEETPASDRKEKKKKGKKAKREFTFDDDPSGSTTPLEPDTVPEVLEDTSQPAEVEAATSIDDAPITSSKDKKKAKKAKKALAFDDDLPSETITPAESDRGIEVLDQVGEEIPLPIETNNVEASEDAPSMSKKEKKKAKRGKRTPVSESEDLEIAPAVEEATPSVVNESAEPLSAVPGVDEADHGEKLETPIDPEISPHVPTASELIDKAVVEDEALVEAELDFPVSSKKSKKDKKKAKKSQALNWDEDDGPRETREDELVAEAGVPSGEAQSADDKVAETTADVPEQADIAAPEADVEQTPTVEPSATPIVVEHELAPRHQDPTAVIDSPDRSEPLDPMTAGQIHDQPTATETATSATNEDATPPQTAIDESSITPNPSVEPSIHTEKPEDEKTAVQDAPINQDDEFPSFITTKKSKKGKKSKKQPVVWEEEDPAVTPRVASVSEPSKALDHESVEVRPEMTAWPTEVRLNQSEGPTQVDEQLSPRGDLLAPDPAAVVDVLSPIAEPVGPSATVDERNDYFGHAPNSEERMQPEPFDHETSIKTTARAPDIADGSPYQEAEASNLREEIPATTAQPETSREQSEQIASTAKSLDDQNVTAEPADDFEGFASKKKDKKSKRKQKKQVVDDVMWEFPTINPPAPPEEEENVAEQRPAEDVTEADLSRDIGAQEQADIPFPDKYQADVQPEPTIPEEPQLEEAAEDEWGSVAKKSKKGKKSKKNREVAQDDNFLPQPTSVKEPEALELLEDPQSEDKNLGPSKQSEDQPSEGQQAAKVSSGAKEAIATAAALGAGVIAAEQLGRKESKKGKKNKKSRQASSNWDEQEQEQESQPVIEPSNQTAADQQIQSRALTPERRRSPIQAWHQYISPSQSPKQSELYEVKEDRSASAQSTRRKRSHDNQRSTPERRSPIEAWHQYNTPRHSPQQSETYDYNPRQADIHGEQPLPKGINRDSAVHVSDSPIVPDDRSPVHRVMRDSGYPDTETSPITGTGGQYQERSLEDLRDSQGAVNTLRESKITNPLNISSEGRDQGQRARSQTPPKWGSEQQNVILPGHAIQPTRSFDELREPSPVSSTTKDRSSVLFESSPSTREEQISQEQRKRLHRSQDSPVGHAHEQDDNLNSRPAARSLNPEREDDSAMVNARAESLAALSGLRPADQGQQRASLFGGPVGVSSDGTLPETPLDHENSTRRRLNTITEYSPEESPLHKKNRDLSDVGSPDRGVKTARRSGTPQAIQKQRASPPPQESGKGMASTDEAMSGLSWPAADEGKYPLHLERSRSRGTEQRPSSHQSNISSLVSSQPKQREYERRSLSGASNRSIESINAIIRTPPDQMRSASGMSNGSSGTPPLRRSDRSVSGDLRGANRKSEAKKRAKQPELESENTLPPSSTTPHDSTKDSGKSRVKEMADVFEGYGDFRGSPASPTRPPSMRRRQSIQVLELESKLDQLVAENRSLHDARQRAQRSLDDAARDRDQEVGSYREGIETRDTWLRQKDAEIAHLNETLGSLQSQVAQLTEVNQGLHAASRELDDHQERYGQLEEEHADTHQRWQQSTRELEVLRDQHAQLSAGMEDIVRHEVNTAVEEKNIELRRLSDELDSAKQQIRTLQQQILASKRSDDSIIPDRDEDYFDAQCQSLCQHVQQWVLRFSKFSDNRACYLASEIRDEKIVDRMENAILDGSDPDDYLADRVKRRDVFMSMVMTMTWEFIFTRYLFGADREQRQKLKSLEKQLSDSPNVSMASVHKWRAITLALLSKREQFVNQRSQDTEAVMHTIFDTLAKILPPPGHLVPQIQQSLRKVLAGAVDLSVEMRTQRAEYVMLPPLQPEYDTNGDLARKVYFNAALMNERGGVMGVSNEELEARRAVVRMVLFPLVVKKGDAGGEEGEEIVVCPAQVLVAADEGEREKGKRVRVVSASEQGGSDVGMVGGNVF